MGGAIRLVRGRSEGPHARILGRGMLLPAARFQARSMRLSAIFSCLAPKTPAAQLEGRLEMGFRLFGHPQPPVGHPDRPSNRGFDFRLPLQLMVDAARRSRPTVRGRCSSGPCSGPGWPDASIFVEEIADRTRCLGLDRWRRSFSSVNSSVRSIAAERHRPFAAVRSLLRLLFPPETDVADGQGGDRKDEDHARSAP